jgi:chromosomal replication initiator protein
MCGAPARPKMLVAHIQAVVASFYGIKVDYMWSAQRSKDIAHPRQVAMFLSRELTPMSLPQIGRRFGKRDHTTVMYAIRITEQRAMFDRELLEDIRILRERLTADQFVAEAPELVAA